MPRVAMEKQYTSMRLTLEARRLLATLALHLGITQTAVLEIALRLLARREHVE